MSSSGVTSIDRQVLGFCLNIDFFNKVKNKIDRTMFDNELKEVFDNIVYSHTKYERSLTVVELSTIFNDRNPALPESSRKRVQEVVNSEKKMNFIFTNGDYKTITLTEARNIIKIHDNLIRDNQIKMRSQLEESSESFSRMSDFSKKALNRVG